MDHSTVACWRFNSAHTHSFVNACIHTFTHIQHVDAHIEIWLPHYRILLCYASSCIFCCYHMQMGFSSRPPQSIQYCTAWQVNYRQGKINSAQLFSISSRQYCMLSEQQFISKKDRKLQPQLELNRYTNRCWRIVQGTTRYNTTLLI